MKIINTQHPEWIAFWNNKIEFIKPTPEMSQCWFEIEDHLVEFHNYDLAWYFTDAHGGQYIVARCDGLYGTSTIDCMGGTPDFFPTLEDAAKAAFGDWFPDNFKGKYTNEGEYVVDGQWLIWRKS